MDYARAIKAINKDAEFIINDSDLDNINWSENNKGSITKQEIVTKSNELQAAEDALPKNVKKSSAKTKLLNLGFDEDEIKIIFGEE